MLWKENYGNYPCDTRTFNNIGQGRCLLGSSAAKRLQVLRVGPEMGDVANVFFCERWH